MSRNPNGGNSIKQLVQVLIITAVAILLVGGALIGLLNAQVGKLQLEADNRQAQVGSSEQVAQRYDMTRRSYDDTIDHLKYLETSVTSTTYVPTMLQQIQTLAQTTHLQVTSIRPGAVQAAAPPKPSPTDTSSTPSTDTTATAPAKKAPPYDTINISLEVTGTYRQTAAFLYDLTRFPKIVAVTSAALHPDSASPSQDPLGSPNIHSTLTITAYLFHDNDAPIAIPGLPASATTPVGVASDKSDHGLGLPKPADLAAAAPGIVPPTTDSATLAAAAQRAMSGATGASNAAKARTELGVGTL